MKNIAIGIMMIIFLSIIIEPLVEVGNLIREKILISTALNNACRAAKDRALVYESLRDLDAVMDEDKFKEYFGEIFATAMDMTYASHNGNEMFFNSYDGKYQQIIIRSQVIESIDYSTSLTTSRIVLDLSTPYKFKTKYLNLAQNAMSVDAYTINMQRTYILSVRN